MDYSRTRLSADILNSKKNKRQFTGMVDCLMKTFKSEGPTGLYRGVFPAMGGVFIFRGLWFGFYDFFKNIFITEAEKHKPNRLKRFMIANVVTITAGYCCYPLDTASRRVMMQQNEKVK